MSDSAENPEPKSTQSPVQLAYAKLNSSALPPQNPGEKPKFDVNTLARADVMTEIRAKIKERGGLYRFAEAPHEIVISEIDAFLDPERKVRATLARPKPLNPGSATTYIEGVAHWFRQNADGNQVPRPIPDWARQLLVQTGEDQLPFLAGIIRHPVIMDGKLVSGVRKYDKATSFYIDAPAPLGEVEPWVETATPKEIVDWLVDEWLGEVQFASRDDALRALMIPMTILVAKTDLRHRKKYPVFSVTAPDQGTGKSDLIHSLVEAVTGYEVGDTPWSTDEAEMGKMLTAAALEDRDVIVWDNLPSGIVFKSAKFDLYCTTTIWRGRILGKNVDANAYASGVQIIAGNNIQPGGDAGSRVVGVRLVPKTEAAIKTYKRESLLAWTRANRATILAAICRLFIHAQMKVEGRFAAWHKLVAAPLISITGRADLLAEWRKKKDVFGNSDLGDFLQALRDAATNTLHNPDAAMTASMLLDHIPEETAAMFGVEDAMLDAILRKYDPGMTDGDKAEIDRNRNSARRAAARLIGKRFDRHADTSANGLRFVVAEGMEDSKPRKAVRAEPFHEPTDDETGPDDH